MVSIWWVVVAFVAGGYAGALLLALLCVARAADGRAGRREGEHRSARREGRPAQSRASEPGARGAP